VGGRIVENSSSNDYPKSIHLKEFLHLATFPEQKGPKPGSDVSGTWLRNLVGFRHLDEWIASSTDSTQTILDSATCLVKVIFFLPFFIYLFQAGLNY
jgi:hypothetical protein